MTTFDEVWTSIADVEGWMTRGQGEALFEAAQACPPGGKIVEIGSFRGRSTIVLASGAPPDVTVIAIDPHAGNDRGPQEIEGFEAQAADDHATFLRNLHAAGVAERVTHLRLFSGAALDQVPPAIDVLYVDGAHRFAPARADIGRFGARVRDGGTMLIHDSFSSIGVTLAILAELVPSRRWRYVRRSRSLAVYRADPTVDRRRNAVRQLAQLPWFVGNVGLKVLLTLGLGRVLRRVGRPVPDWPY
ncbi:MAG: class I SAM-dependent methyltransferase [Ilumatobacter sp.]|nr:class I SAM-dependent methyltransferase [Ilumatobacter sp.]